MRVIETGTNETVLVELPDGSDMWMTTKEHKLVEKETDVKAIRDRIASARYGSKAFAHEGK